VSGPIEIITETETEATTAPADIETQSLLLETTPSSEFLVHEDDFSLSKHQGLVIATVQLLVTVVLLFMFNYGNVDEYSTQKYIVFRDIMVMLLLGFGYCKWTEKKARILIFDMSSLT
jgi:hypothetical protein